PFRDPRIASFDQYLLTDPPRAGPTGGFASGLEFKDGTPKAMLAAFRMPIYLPATSGKRGQPLEVWGCVRPARFARLDSGQPQRVEIQFRAAGQLGFRTVRTVTLTDPFGYFDVSQAFSGGGAVRLAWSYPHGQRVFSRVVSIVLR